jgi:hypothetical protein
VKTLLAILLLGCLPVKDEARGKERGACTCRRTILSACSGVRSCRIQLASGQPGVHCAIALKLPTRAVVAVPGVGLIKGLPISIIENVRPDRFALAQFDLHLCGVRYAE